MDWAELNPDLLHLISKKLGDIYNFVCFRAVCKNWRLVIGLRDCPPQLPWFLEYHYGDSSDRNFFSLYSNRTHTLHIPQARGKVLFGSASWYLFMHEHENHSVLNPLSRSHFSIPKNENCLIGCPIYVGPNHNPNPSPNENDDVIIVILNLDKNGSPHPLVVWRPVDRQLTKIVEIEFEVCYMKLVTCFKGRLFVVDKETGETRVFDVATGDEVLVIPPADNIFDYLIEACDDLIGVVKKYISVGVWQFDVYRLEDGGTSSHWVRMTSGIGDRMLFLDETKGYRQSRGLCLKASDFEGFRGNCIYFTTWSRESQYSLYLGRYDLESKETQMVHHPSRSGFSGTLFVPSLY
ncbi:hypothetical protein LUZ60_007218 [Juncus effusus]|nr:hypothetical protein LUZ60_007218 [Juncus effusus]